MLVGLFRPAIFAAKVAKLTKIDADLEVLAVVVTLKTEIKILEVEALAVIEHLLELLVVEELRNLL